MYQSDTVVALEIVFDGPPGPCAGRFVEAEDGRGKGLSVGEWKKAADGATWSLCLRRFELEFLLRRSGMGKEFNGQPDLDWVRFETRMHALFDSNIPGGVVELGERVEKLVRALRAEVKALSSENADLRRMVGRGDQ